LATGAALGLLGQGERGKSHTAGLCRDVWSDK
jgi:hypothetical protein